MPWNDLVTITNKAKARAKILKSMHLNQWYPKEKWLLKMSLHSRNNQTDKKTLQAKEKASAQAKQQTKKLKKSEKSKKSKKTRKEKKKN